MADFDVLCVQEVGAGQDQLPGCDGADQFEQLAALLPGYAPIRGVATDVAGRRGMRRRFGNMILSRLPVLQVFPHLLPWPAEDGVMSMQRIALEATLQSPAGLLRVLTTHLEYYAPSQRAAQVERLRELQREAFTQAHAQRPGAAQDGPFEAQPRAAAAVLVGDFNFPPDAPEHARLIAPMDGPTPPWCDAWAIANPGTAHAPTVGLHDKVQWPGPPFTFDFVFVSADLAPRVRSLRVDARTDASDHQPMLLELA
jgi:endonuclease/exonuclease/phosphatase family metal-dependent hydrolase